MTPRQGMRILAIVDRCGEEIKRRGSRTNIVIKMPGNIKGKYKRRFCKKGPRGSILGRTQSGKHILVDFNALMLRTRLEGIFYGHATCKPGN